MIVIHINGRPGVGKKSIGAVLARWNDARFIDNHTLLNPGEAVAGRGTEGYYRVADAVREAVYGEAQRALPLTPMIFTNALTREVPRHRENFARLAELADAAGVPFMPVTLICDLDENCRRIAAPGRADARKLTNPQELRGLYKNFTIIAPEDAFTLDVTTLGAEEAAAHIQQALRRRHPLIDAALRARKNGVTPPKRPQP